MNLSNRIDIVIISLMIAFAMVQYNDKDGIIWMFAYLAVAGVAFLNFKSKPRIMLTRSLLVVYVLVLSYYIPHLIEWVSDGMPSITSTMKAETPYVELVREAGGLLICCFLMLYYTSRKY